jgi:hypothetical protein
LKRGVEIGSNLPLVYCWVIDAKSEINPAQPAKQWREVTRRVPAIRVKFKVVSIGKKSCHAECALRADTTAGAHTSGNRFGPYMGESSCAEPPFVRENTRYA